MPEVTHSTLYRVTVTEYKRGWGQRVDPNDTKLFTTLAEAEKYASHWERCGGLDYYFQATIEKIR